MQQIAPITNTEQVPSIGSIKTADVQFPARCFLHGGNFVVAHYLNSHQRCQTAPEGAPGNRHDLRQQ